jgi:hypothetical protein
LGKRKDKFKGPLIAALLLSVVGVGVSAPSGVSAAPLEPGAPVAPQTRSPLGLLEATNDLVRLAPGQVPVQQPGWLPALAPGALPAPQQLEPANGAHTTGNPADPTPGRALYRPLGVPCFRWGSVAGATKYELQVSEVQQDTAIVLSKPDVRQTTYCPTAYDFSGHGIQDGLTYYWRVRAYGGTPVAWGDWSPWRGFTRHWASVPVLSWPTASAVLTRPPVLSWTPVDGTEYYKLEVSSDPDFPDPSAQRWPNFTWKLTTRNTAFALATQGSNKLPNDEDIYWRVRAVGAAAGSEEYRWGPWSASGDFGLCWSCNLVPELGAGNERRPLPLTPVNLEDHVHSAYFSWTPVEGAKTYDLEAHRNASFEPADQRIVLFENVANPGLLVPIEYNWGYPPLITQVYWRVRARNYYDVYGEWNNETPNASASFRPEDTWINPVSESIVPDLLFPEFYYKPVYTSSVWEDRTAAVPTFMWNQVPGAISYTIEVATNKFFSPISWMLTTENLSATPLVTESLKTAGVYYWHVQATDSGGSLPWSQRWEAQVDQARRVFTPTAPPPRLVHPTCQLEGDGLTYGQQVLEHFPHLDWVPVSGADHYEVQISTSPEPDFTASLVETATTELTSYTPVTRYPPDTYYWRVQARDSADGALGAWSEVYHFALMRQFAPQALYSVGLERLVAPFSAETLLTEDPLGDQSGGEGWEGYDLAALYTSLDNNFWYLGWSVYTSTQPIRFQLYLDLEGADGEGLTTSPYPEGGTLPNASEPYRPEYVLQWDMFGASGMPTVTLFSKLGSEWDYDPLLDIGGRAVYTETSIYSDTAGFVLLAVPHTAIKSPATMNCLLVSVNPTTTQVVDTMDRGYVTVSTAPAPLTPPTSHVDEARHVVYPRMPLITWHTLTNIVTVRFRSNVDVSFSGQQTEYGRIPKDPMAFSGSNPYYLSHRIYADNMTHYWQILSKYKVGGDTLETTWSRPVRFTKRAQTPTHLTISGAVVSGTLLYVDMTPVFSWDPVQGAAGYRFELIGGAYNETLHGSSSNSYIPAAAVPNGDYEWRVRIIDGSGNWSLDNYASGRFQKGSDVPTALFPIDPRALTDTVYFRWEPLTGAAYYKVEVAADENFTSAQKYDKINNTIFVPEQIPSVVTKGTFYWRVCGYNSSGHFMGCEAYYIERYPEKVYLPVVLRNKR